MSQHPSLRSSDKDKQHRSVLKRYERIKILKEKERWKESDSVFGLEKVKVLRFKIKKEKAAKVAEGAEAAAAAPGQAAATAGAPQTAPGQAKAAPKTASGGGLHKEGAKPQTGKEQKK